MKTDNRILDPEMYRRTGAVRGGVFLAAILSALLGLALASAVNPAAAENGPATISETSKENEQETVEVTYDEAELEMAGLINDYREEKGVEPLLVSDTASLAAKRHSEDMARYGFMDYDSQDSAYFDHGASFDERLEESGYDHNTALAENIAAGAGVEETFERWKRSPDHEKNVLDPDMEVIGVGLSTGGESADSADLESSESSQEGEYGSYWTTDFGAHTDGTATEPSKIQAEPDPDEPGNGEEPAPGNPKNPEDNASGEQYEQGSKPGTEDEASPDDETGSTGGGDGASGDSDESSGESGDGEQGVTEQGITEEQYSTGDEDPADEGSSNEGSSGDDQGETGEQTTEERTTEQPSGDRGNEGSPARSGGGRSCDTLAGFDKSPFDPDFGSELSRLIRAKVDCKLAEAGIGAKEAQDGQDKTVAGSGEDTTQQNTASEKTANDTGGETEGNEGNEGFLSGMFAGSSPDEDEDSVAQKPNAAPSTSGDGGGEKVGPTTGTSTGESAPEPGDEPTDEPDAESGDEPDEATPAVLGPASTESATPDDNGRED